jgi:hypothetical protein
MSDHLPGMFSHNPFSSGIDGSLWTLRYEALCYVAVLALGLVRLLTKWVVSTLFVIILAARHACISAPMPGSISARSSPLVRSSAYGIRL